MIGFVVVAHMPPVDLDVTAVKAESLDAEALE
jgi:hypothetical protein